MASAESVRAALDAGFSPTHLVVVDDSGGCGAKFSVTIVSARFDGIPLLARHRLVNETLKQEMQSIHALSIKALTPAQYEAQQATAATAAK